MEKFLLRLLTFGISLTFMISTARSQDLPDVTINNPKIEQKGTEVLSVIEESSFSVSVDLTFQSQEPISATISTFLSRDTKFSSDDLKLAEQEVSSLQSGSVITFSVSAPSAYLGEQYVVVVANSSLSFMESSFENNTTTSALTIEENPENDFDFEMSGLDLELTTVNAGSSLSIDYTLTTVNTTKSYNPVQGFYLSLDKLLDSDDHYLGESTDTPSPVNFSVPGGTDPGDWNVLVKVDHSDEHLETDEDNNLFTTALVVNPQVPVDLTVKSITTATPEITSEESVNLNVIFENAESGSAPGFHFSFYYSDDDLYGSDDFLLYENTYTNALSGHTETGTLTYSTYFPDYIPLGSGYIIAVVDDNLNQAETNEQNNIRTFPITVNPQPQPDLIFETITVNPGVTGVGSEFSVAANIANQGTVSSGSFEVTYYLSSDSILSESDEPLYPSVEFTGLAAAASLSRESTGYMIPAASDTGDFVLLATIDPLDVVKESNEMNNDTSFAISVKAPDLVITELQTDAEGYGAGYTVDVTLRAKNESESVASPQSQVHFYLSKDDLIDESDLKFLPVETVESLGANVTSGELSASLNLPGVIDAGTYNLIASIDDSELITETDNDNNTFATVIEVKLPDLTVKNAIINPGVVDGGKTTDALFRIENLGDVNSLESSIQFFLSANDLFEPELDTVQLNTYFFSGLKGDTLTNEIQHELMIPDLPGGDFYVIFFLDADSSLLETDETNNQAAVDLKINNADLTIKNLSAEPLSVGIGQSTNVSFNISNTGDATSDPAMVSYMVRKAEESEYLLFEDITTVEEIQPAGNSSKIEFDLYVPDHLEQGEYFVTITVDTYDQIVEYNEENNKDSIAIDVSVPDLTVENPLVNPSVVSLGYTTEFEITVKNESEVLSPPSVVHHYLSTDQILSEDDYFLTSSYSKDIKPANDTTIASSPVAIPSFFEAGEYYIVFKADGTETIFETNEENNIAVAEITLKAPDLIVSNAATDKDVIGAGSSFKITGRVKNESETAKAPASSLGFYISEDEELDDEDIFIQTASVDALELSSTSSEISSEFFIPNDFEAGDYTLILVADYDDRINETDETNNTATITITVDNTDLTVDNLLLSNGVAENGALINASVEVHNEGTVDASDFLVSFFLSTADTLNEESVLLNHYYIEKLEAEKDTTLSDQNVQFNLPGNLKGGDYIILAYVDSEFAISETNEDNNIVHDTIQINTPDLVISGVETEDLTAGSTFDFSFRIKNNGSVEVNTPVRVNFYLTKKDTLGEEDNEIRYLAQHTYEDLIQGNGTGNLIDKTLSAPIDLDTGSWYLAMYIDPFDAIPETDEFNNTSFEPVKVAGTDIGIHTAKIYPEIILPDSINASGVDPSEPIQVQALFSLFNLSETAISAPHSTTHIYFSENDVLDENDMFLKNLEDIHVNREDTGYIGNIQVDVSPDIAPGMYYFLFVTDALDTINELDESNNILAVSLQVSEPYRADLTPVSQTLSLNEVASGRELSVVAKINNIGEEEAPAYRFSAFLSDDEQLDEQDIELATQSTLHYFPDDFLSQDVHPIRNTRTFSYDVKIPRDIPAGDYTVLTFADSKDTVGEANESNNKIFRNIAVRDPYPVDYGITFSSTLPEVIHAGSYLDFSYHLENLGTGLANDTVGIGYYLSPDATWDSSDELLGADTLALLTPYDVEQFIREITIPAVTAPDTYYFILFADNDDIVSEEDENNNQVAIEVTVEEALAPDLRVTNFFAFDRFNPNVSSGIQADIQNIGKGSAEEFNVSFYLSTNNIWSSDDRKLQGFEIDQIKQGGQTYTGQWSLYLPIDVELGSYFLIAIADGDDALEESNETNNTFILPIDVGDAQAPDLIVYPANGSFTIYEGETAGVSYDISFLLGNEGNVGIDDPDFNFYLSFDEVFDDTDINLDLAFDPYVWIEAFEFTEQDFSVIFPENLIAGEYTIFMVGDPDNNLIEFNEENNLGALTLMVNPPSKPDLSITEFVTSFDEVSANTLLEVTYMVSNFDRAPVSGAKLNFYLSKDPTLSDEDLQVGEDSIIYLSGFGSTERVTEMFINRSVQAGTYYLLAQADPENLIEESDENNNLTEYMISVSEPVDPNVIIVSMEVPELVSANSLIAFSGLLYNDTTGSAIDIRLDVYLSQDETVDEGDALVYSETVGNLAGKAFLPLEGEMIVPLELAGTTSYVLTVADPENTIIETSEEDNKYLTSMTIAEPVYPDLLVYDVLGLADFIHAGQSDDFSMTIQNISEGFAERFMIRGYLSSDATLDESDLQVMELENTERLTTGIYDFPATLSPEGSVPPGDYTLLLSVDTDNEVEETDEMNNNFTAAITIGEQVFPDLVVEAVQVNPQKVNAALETTVSVELTNSGLAASGENSVSFYLSGDDQWDNTDEFLGDEPVSALDPGNGTTLLSSVIIPGPTTPGSYYIVAVADVEDQLTEQDETNNEGAEAVEVLERLYPDLVVTSGVADPNPVNAGLTTSISFSAKNTGEAPAPASSAGIYLSANESLDEKDELIGTASVAEFTLNGSALGQTSVQIPVDTSPGNYFIIVKANDDGTIEESDDSNNTFSFAIEILEKLYPDLIVTNTALNSASINAGTNATLTFDVRNVGEASSAASTVKVYFSEDNALDEGDEEVGSQSLDIINANTAASVSIFAKVPVTTSEGTYYFLVEADAGNTNEESDETNNHSGVSLTVTAPLPADLTVADVSLSQASVPLGSSFAVDVTIQNLSANDALPSKVGLYISNDEVLDDADALLAIEEVGVITLESSEVISASVVVPSSMSVGDYYLIALADDEEALEETDEDNNNLSVEIELIEPLGIRTESGILLYPNPVLTELRVIHLDKFSGREMNVEFFTLDGRLVLKTSQEVVSGSITIPAGSLTTGNYLMILKGEGIELEERIIKQ